MNDKLKYEVFKTVFNYFKSHRYFLIVSISIVAIILTPLDCSTRYGEFKKGGLKYFAE